MMHRHTDAKLEMAITTVLSRAAVVAHATGDGTIKEVESAALERRAAARELDQAEADLKGAMRTIHARTTNAVGKIRA